MAISKCGSEENSPPATLSGDKQKTGKKHPPPPKPRPPPPENTAPPTPVDPDCTTSEDEDASVRRAPPRQSKKQKRAQKVQEVREDRAVLQEMKNPLPSTSGPLMREQNKLKLLYPKKFIDETPSTQAGATTSTQTQTNTSESEVARVKRDVDLKRSGAKRAKVGIRGDNARAPVRPTRGSSKRIRLNSEPNDKIKEKEKSPEPEPLPIPSNPAPAKNKASSVIKIRRSEKKSSPATATPPESNLSPPVPTPDNDDSPVQVVEIKPEPTPKEKRQRKLPTRLMSPDILDLPPILFRIGSSGSINMVDGDEGPPELKPMSNFAPPPSPRLKYRPGKENLVTPRKQITESPVPQDSNPRPEEKGEDVKGEKDGSAREPARKRVARNRISPSPPAPSQRKKVRDTPKSEEHQGPRLRTRSSNRRSEN